MQLIPTEQFLSLLRAYGLEPKPSRDDFQYLQMHGTHESRFWITPQETRKTTAFLQHFLMGMDTWQEAIVWPRHARWTFTAPPDSPSDSIVSAIMHAAGLPDNAVGAAIFPRAEINKIVAVLFAHAAFGINTHDDLYLIPDHAQQLIHTDHHDVVHLTCRTHKRLESFVDHMKRNGYSLPTELPDETFKRPSWMPGEK